MNWPGIRNRLTQAIERELGELSPATVAKVAERANLRYTTLARFVLYEEPKRTLQLQQRTVLAICKALDLNPDWLLDGEGARQLGFWPMLLPDTFKEKPSAVEEMRTVFEFATQITDSPARTRICRAIAGACIEASVREGIAVPVQVYTSLLRIDSSIVGKEQRRGA